MLNPAEREGNSDLVRHYQEIEAAFNVVDRVCDYATLVIPTDNAKEPFHRWFHFKEGFSHHLLPRLMKDDGWTPDGHLTIIDPFLGSGTSLLSGAQLARDYDISARLIGCERNPAIYRIAAAKIQASTAGTNLLQPFDAAKKRFWSRAEASSRRNLSTASATLNNKLYFETSQVKSLLAMASAASDEDDLATRTLLEAAVACAVERTARLRRDGRALRYQPSKKTVDAIGAVRSVLALMRADIAGVDPSEKVSVDVHLGDARDLTRLPGEADWAVFSPPYPNNIDYTEVYKTEAWVLGLYANADEMRQQRLQTLRSHPSVKFAEEYGFIGSKHQTKIADLLKPVLASIPDDDRYSAGRRQVVQGYTDDMLRVMTGLHDKTKQGGRGCIVVGNSSHGPDGDHFVLAADLIVARVCELTGWTVDEIRICRRPARRADSGGYLRESAVMLTRA